MGWFIEGEDRHQTMLLPVCLVCYVDKNSVARAIDAFVDMVDPGACASPSGTLKCSQPENELDAS